MYIDRRKIIIISAAAAVLIALIVGAVLIFSKRPDQSVIQVVNVDSNPARTNTLALAKEYNEKGEYQRALDLLDRLLIEDASDSEARALRDEAIEGNKKEREAALQAAQAAQAAAMASNNASASLSAEDIAAQRRLEEEQRRLEEDRRRAREAELARQREEAELAALRAAEQRAAAEAAAAERRAAAEAEAARRQAEEAELARKSQELQNQMRAVNDLVSQGKVALGNNNYAGASSLFNEALQRVPAGESQFEAQKLADIGEAYYENYAGNPGTVQGEESLKQAANYARDSVRKDASQALPHFTLGKVYSELKQWDNATPPPGNHAGHYRKGGDRLWQSLRYG